MVRFPPESPEPRRGESAGIATPGQGTDTEATPVKTLGAYLLLVLLVGCCTFGPSRDAKSPMPGAASQVLSQENRAPSEAERRALIASGEARIQSQLESVNAPTQPREQKVQYLDSRPSATYLR